MNYSKRIMRDIQMFKKSNLEKEGIHCFFNDENIYNVLILIIGPNNTPYEKGFYLFKLTFPANYPFSPPIVKFCTYGNNIRFNPNLYINGKVCISILNTWDGPGWTSCCSLNSVLLSLQSLLNENPIQNEPGWQDIKPPDSRAVSYNTLLEYCNVKIAVLDTLENIDKNEFRCFKEILINYFLKYKGFYNKIINDPNNNKKTLLKSYIYNLYIEMNQKNSQTIFSNLYNKYKHLDLNLNNTEIGPIKTRKAPIKNSKFFEVGYEQISENNNKLYIVVLTKTNKKRWKLK